MFLEVSHHHSLYFLRTLFLNNYVLDTVLLVITQESFFAEAWIVSAGKLNRGLSVIDSYKLLKEGKDLTENEVFLASALGWCIEWVGSRS